jgi:hypothetical protein
MVLLLTLAGACGGDDDDTETAGFELAAELTPQEMTTTVAALCTAAGQAPADPLEAEKTFAGKAHEGLHSIARQLEDTDRAAAGALLKAKMQVESDFAGGAANDTIRTDLLALADAAGAGVERLVPAAAVPDCG